MVIESHEQHREIGECRLREMLAMRFPLEQFPLEILLQQFLHGRFVRGSGGHGVPLDLQVIHMRIIHELPERLTGMADTHIFVPQRPPFLEADVHDVADFLEVFVNRNVDFMFSAGERLGAAASRTSRFAFIEGRPTVLRGQNRAGRLHAACAVTAAAAKKQATIESGINTFRLYQSEDQ